MTHPWGLCHSFQNRTVALPLLQVKAVASLKELAAQVKITQTYSNDTDEAIEAVYSFPIPARAAVCSFVMIKEDETRIVGHVEEKGEAMEIYESAIAQGKQAALMQQQTPDVFKLAVGNIQPHEQVQIELIYATELTEDEENDSVRLHLPVHIGARYGIAPDAQINPRQQQTSHTFLEICIDVEAAAPIANITCPSHTVSTELGPDPTLPNALELPFSNYARISLTSAAPLDKDFVLAVKSAGLDAPRCVAEPHPIHPTTALAFTVVPRFKLPDVSRQEFVFLVDRSGSMGGACITAAKKALIVMLRSLPVKESLFQIASFGNTCTPFWEAGSQPYNQATLEHATQHVDGMTANCGGTEIRKALQKCFESRKTDCPTSIFLLTDGEAWDLDGVFKEVKDAVAKAPPQAYLRVFVLGIGNSASTAMCEGIARLGHGTCMMVGEQESFTGKIARMLKAARTPLITDISVDWGVQSVEAEAAEEDDAFVMVAHEETADVKGKDKELSLFDETADPLQMDNQPAPPAPKIVLAPPPPVQQSPFKIRALNPGNRIHVHAILQGCLASKTAPKTVTLSGLTEDGSKIKLSVPVTLSNLPNTPDSPSAIHALAARKIIQDIEDGQHAIQTSVPDDADLLARTVKASIVRLAKTYSITSSQTSFVAVDESG
ncbi:von Willebrand factor type A domain-containing protein, partial [Mycena sanguinolenta]